MIRQSYFKTEKEIEANICDSTVPILVNAAGVEYFYAPFKQSSIRYDYGFVYVVSGEMFFENKGKRTVLKNGEFKIGGPHDYETYFGTDSSYLNYYWLNFTGGAVEELINKIGISFSTCYKCRSGAEIENELKKIFGEFIIDDEYFLVRCEAALVNILSAVARDSKTETKHLLKSVEFIHKNYDKNITVKELADMEGLSASHYFSVFKKNMGVAPLQYLTQQRINSACVHLQNNNYSISQIAEMVGYSDVGYFIRIFKKTVGVTPNRYRQNI